MKSKLQIKRESKDLTIDELAKQAYVFSNDEVGSLGHFLLTIKYIETGIPECPRPRLTYEYTALAKALNCSVNDIYGIKELANG